MTEHDNLELDEYKTIETRLYGDLMKTCRRYSRDLNLISILGILEIVKQEMKDLDKIGRSTIKDGISEEGLSEEEKRNLDTLV